MRRPTTGAGDRAGVRIAALRLLLAGALGIAAAILVACGSSSGKLIPAADAGPLQADFEAIAQAAQSGNGDCAETEAAIQKTERDFAALPPAVDTGLRNTLRQGIANLHKHALELCKQPIGQPTTTTSAPKTTSTGTTSTPTTPTQTSTTTPTTTTPTTPATPTTSVPGGGTPAPEHEHEPAPEGGGTKPGEGGGAGGQEGGK